MCLGLMVDGFCVLLKPDWCEKLGALERVDFPGYFPAERWGPESASTDEWCPVIGPGPSRGTFGVCIAYERPSYVVPFHLAKRRIEH